MSIPFIFKRIHPSLKIVGLAILSATFHFSTSYNIILSYCYSFMFTSFQSPLPFADEAITDNKYLHDDVLHQSGSINEFGSINPALFILYIASMALCHYVVKDGAKSTGQVVVVTASMPYVIFIILILRGLFLEGAFEGLAYLFTPKWELLWNYNIWIEATTQVFYQMSIGIGLIVNLATAKAKREDIMKSVIIVPLGLILCGLLSAMTIFIYLSHFCAASGFAIDDPSVKLSGMELSFNVLPKALLLLPLPNLWEFIFFSAMVLLGIDSQFGFI
jgi:SNF family Na+-dependent transporter